MTPALAVDVAMIFVWLGMVLAISFVETPLKFRAPGVTLPIGLGIGRLVFRALNAIEVVLAAIVLITMIIGRPSRAAAVASVVAIMMLVAQLLMVRPRLSRRTAAVVAGREGGRRSRAHLGYVALEMIKVAALIVGGILLLAS